jgi:nucleotide-binding universal stress UspA family protein
MASGPILVAYDGSPASEHALRQAGELLAPRPALVVVVTKEGVGFELMELPTANVGLPPAALDVRTAIEVDETMHEHAQRLAQKGVGLARDAGFEAEGLAVAEDLHVPVAEAIVRVANERDAQAVVVGAHGHSKLGDVILGSTSRDVIRHAPCPVVVARALRS